MKFAPFELCKMRNLSRSKQFVLKKSPWCEICTTSNSWFTLIWGKHSSKCETKWKFHESLISPLNLNGELRDGLWQMTFEAPKKRFISMLLCGPFQQMTFSAPKKKINLNSDLSGPLWQMTFKAPNFNAELSDPLWQMTFKAPKKNINFNAELSGPLWQRISNLCPSNESEHEMPLDNPLCSR
jgi:hypothetical protein